MNKILAAALALTLTAGAAWITPDDEEAPAAPPAPAYSPVGSLDALMTGHGMAFGGIREALPDKENRRRPRTLQINAELLAELANINTYWGRRDDYRNWAGELRDTALELADAVKKRDSIDEARVEAAYRKLDATCTACHEVYK